MSRFPFLSIRLFLFSSLATILLMGCQETETTVPKPVASAPFGTQSLAEANLNEAAVRNADSTMQAFVKEGLVPGVQMWLFKGESLVHHSQAGWENPVDQVPLREDAIYRLASMSKPITAVAILQLMEAGLLQLDDPVSTYLPTFAAPQVMTEFHPEDSSYIAEPAKREVSIRDLLTHSSGIGYPFIQQAYGALAYPAGILDGMSLDSVTLEDQIPLIGKIPLLHQPGEAYTYGLSLDVLGHVVEVVSGQALDEYFSEHIFEPLGMDDTYFYLPQNKTDRLVPIISMVEANQFIPMDQLDTVMGRAMSSFPYSGAQTYFSGGSGLCGTGEDYARFATMLTQMGTFQQVSILKKETVALMGTDQILGDPVYGLGVSVRAADSLAKHPDLPGPLGWGGIFKTTFTSDPSNELTVVFMAQTLPNSAIDAMYEQCRIFLSQLAKTSPIKLAAHP
ncbi:MAG: serine hydrolase domain-containing protein [Bacteroidota bacterium]